MRRRRLIASTHLAVGAAVGLAAQKLLSPEATSLKRLFGAFIAGFVSHLVLDAFPHGEYLIDGFRLGTMVLVEAGIVFALVLSSRNSLLINAIIFFGMAGGAMPDAVYFANEHLFGLTRFGDLGSMIHLFSHDAVPLGFEVSIYFQLLMTFAAIVFVRLKLAS